MKPGKVLKLLQQGHAVDENTGDNGLEKSQPGALT
jgi:hypothetical protein